MKFYMIMPARVVTGNYAAVKVADKVAIVHVVRVLCRVLCCRYADD